MASMFERFSDDARRTVVRALVESRRLGHNYVGTEHTLIALAAGNGTASAALEAEGVTVERARVTVAEMVEGERAPSPWDTGPYTARAKHIFELGIHEALGLGHDYVANGHLLLGILGLGQGNAMRTLEYLGVDCDELRLRLEDGLASSAPPRPPEKRRATIGTSQMGIQTVAPAAAPTHSKVVDVRDPAPAAPSSARPARGRTCSFCDGEMALDGRFIAGASAAICAECVRACAQLLGYNVTERVRL
jgi:ATP-dependent Clp protease ATP-binding subunit ClpA